MGVPCAPESATLPFPTLKNGWGGEVRWDNRTACRLSLQVCAEGHEPRVSRFQIVGDPQQQNLSADSVSRYKDQPREHLSPKSTHLSED